MQLTSYSAKKPIEVTITNIVGDQLTYVHEGKSVTKTVTGEGKFDLLQKVFIGTDGLVYTEAVKTPKPAGAKVGGSPAYTKTY